jgi:uncharacterized lipoprotein YmbA
LNWLSSSDGGGKFKDDFLSVLASNISILLGTDQVFVYPWLDKVNPAYRIDIEVYRFDGKLGDSVTLHAGWILRTPDQKNQVRLRRWMISEPVTGNEFDALISAKSRAIEKFSVLIVETIKKDLKRQNCENHGLLLSEQVQILPWPYFTTPALEDEQ